MTTNMCVTDFIFVYLVLDLGLYFGKAKKAKEITVHVNLSVNVYARACVLPFRRNLIIVAP
jgi:hypothetical protein